MPRYERKALPPGFILREFPPEQPGDKATWQAYRERDPEQHSPRYSRRVQAVDWCYALLGKEAAARSAS